MLLPICSGCVDDTEQYEYDPDDHFPRLLAGAGQADADKNKTQPIISLKGGVI